MLPCPAALLRVSRSCSLLPVSEHCGLPWPIHLEQLESDCSEPWLQTCCKKHLSESGQLARAAWGLTPLAGVGVCTEIAAGWRVPVTYGLCHSSVRAVGFRACSSTAARDTWALGLSAQSRALQ